ncbi:hypothetical protein [Gallaecimonas mangrovi]|uniref:hypothetical protein n=1 Tax=Gallaecimonas mangrovi TaxID=2291597 RepID=UPI000E2025AD|nr:hypothetical protein [Gallaecimonas mangrovi]
MSAGQLIERFAKISFAILLMVLVTAVFLKTSLGQRLIGFFFSSPATFSPLVEEEKSHNLHKRLDLTVPVVVGSLHTQLGQVLTRKALVMPYVEGCPPCETLINYMGKQEHVPFLVITFAGETPPKPAQLANTDMVIVKTHLAPKQLYMDAKLSPVLYEINDVGAITAKHLGFSEGALKVLINRYR